MITSHRAAILLGLLALCAAPAGAERPNVHFDVSAGEQASRAFQDAVAKLHCFEYRSAEAAFQKAWELEPGFAMAAWGEALCHVHPLWNEEDLSKGRRALARLGKTPDARLAKAKTERERAFLEASMRLFGEGERPERYRAYEESMRRVHERWPDDVEAAAFYGLAILGTAMGVRDRAIYDRAAAVMEPYLDKHPLHPGLAHYIVHCYDDPDRAERGLEAARALAKAAPGSSHALHMPSHIFLALGLWDEVVDSNLQSWRVSEETNHHALYWLHYGMLQQGRAQHAAPLLTTMQAHAEANSTVQRRVYLVLMRAAHLVDGGCDAPVPASTVDLDGLNIEFHAAHHLAEGYCAWRRGDKAALAAAHATLAQTLRSVPEPETRVGRGNLRDARLALLELQALELDAGGDLDGAIQRLRDGLERAAEQPLEFGPPSPPKPVGELLGELLLKAGRTEHAAVAFRSCLERHPKRAASVEGLARAERAGS